MGAVMSTLRNTVDDLSIPELWIILIIPGITVMVLMLGTATAASCLCRQIKLSSRTRDGRAAITGPVHKTGDCRTVDADQLAYEARRINRLEKSLLATQNSCRNMEATLRKLNDAKLLLEATVQTKSREISQYEKIVNTMQVHEKSLQHSSNHHQHEIERLQQQLTSLQHDVTFQQTERNAATLSLKLCREQLQDTRHKQAELEAKMNDLEVCKRMQSMKRHMTSYYPDMLLTRRPRTTMTLAIMSGFSPQLGYDNLTYVPLGITGQLRVPTVIPNLSATNITTDDRELPDITY